ncbi:MAG TPA: RNA methyltransferase [Bacteroidetes bacterium]|nr:RNA methyltransferase [Bacteroidota bacterium]
MTEKRLKRIEQVVGNRQFDLTVVLNNVHDPHNIGAVLRSCDSVGIKEIYVLYTDNRLDEENLILGKKAASSARKWVDVFYYNDVEKCFDTIKKKYDNILGTKLNSEAVSLYDLDLTGSLALVFGNERDGISEEVLPYLTGNFIIPQVGMIQSLNISVAVAVSLYETFRQRNSKNMYNAENSVNEIDRKNLLEDYIERHKTRHTGRLMIKK